MNNFRLWDKNVDMVLQKSIMKDNSEFLNNCIIEDAMSALQDLLYGNKKVAGPPSCQIWARWK